MENLSDFELDELTNAFHRAIEVNAKATLLALRDIQPESYNTRATKPEKLSIDWLYADETIIIKACDGQETLADAKDVFDYRSDHFEKWYLNKKGHATPNTPVKVYDWVQRATFYSMFSFLRSNLDQNCLTQSQIKTFARDHRAKLSRDGHGTFFLFKENNEYFIANVHFVTPNEICVDVYGLEDGISSNFNSKRRLVIPRLKVA